MRIRLLIAFFILSSFLSQPTSAQNPVFDAVQSHIDRFHLYGLDAVGPTRSGIWSDDFDTRLLNAGESSNLLRSLPLVAFSLKMAERSGCKCYTEAAESNLKSWRHFSLSDQRSLIFTHEQNYDFTTDRFVGDIDRISFGPDLVPWQIPWQLDPDATQNSIVQLEFGLSSESLRETTPETAMCIFDAISFLASKSSEEDLCAIRESCHSLRQKIAKTWSSQIETSLGLSGLWAQCQLNASVNLDDPAFLKLAVETLKAAEPVMADKTQPILRAELTTKYQAHPIQFASASFSAFALSQNQDCLALAKRFAKSPSLTELDPKQAIAEDYGRAIGILNALASETKSENHRLAEKALIDQVMKTLYDPTRGMFRSNPNDRVCRQSEGIALLLSALIMAK